MIRINLLGVPKPKKGKRAATPTMAGDGPNPLLLGVVVLLIGAAAMAGWWWKLNNDAMAIQKRMDEANRKYAALQIVKQKYEESQKQADLYQRRIKVIDDLRAAQSGPAQLLTMVGDTVNATDGVWLEKMVDQGGSIDLQGMALSIHGVANLMEALQKTGKFKSVEIKESYQDANVKDMQAFVFTLTCEKKS
jgi:Tfp pilus assembly protein PilN